ncbi:glutaredoxin family protein [Paenibacillus sp. TAB 01]|uniref:glutaredoxin family protein n=1 Tax=Paenibacillus sp. TAB 01 TaxID=3368988 RepID=UPI0037510CEC
MSTTTPVIVYSSNTCGYCKQLKKYLSDENIAFEERNVDTNDAYYDELEALGVSSLPVTLIGDAKILGMNTTRIKSALGM